MSRGTLTASLSTSWSPARASTFWGWSPPSYATSCTTSTSTAYSKSPRTADRGSPRDARVRLYIPLLETGSMH
uniref:Putative secreted protein n=1 Tax=Ixodes scapularis TaxID=6945 RepID=A0A4D5RCD1_IXOSC